MDELGEITDYIYEVASEDALIIRGLSKDDTLSDEISVTVIATGFEANNLFDPSKPKRQPETFDLLSNKLNADLVETLSELPDELLMVHGQSKRSLVNDLGYETQQIIEFDVDCAEPLEVKWQKNMNVENENEIAEVTLKKAQHIQKLLHKEGFSNKVIKENIDIFEDIPAYKRRNIPIQLENKASESTLSRFTLGADEDNEPVFRENNAYLNNNVD
jgi:cell division protein FtsZ